MKALGTAIGGIVPALSPQRGDDAGKQPLVSTQAAAERVLHAPLSEIAQATLAALDAPLVRVEKPDPRWPNASPLVSYAEVPLPRGAGAVVDEVQERLAALRGLLAPAAPGVVGEWVITLASRTHFRSRGTEAQAEIAATTQALCEPGAGLPGFCFTEETVWGVIDASTERGKRWFPPASAIRDALLPLTGPLRAEIERLARLLSRLRERAPGNLLAAPQAGNDEVFTDAEIDAWITTVAAAPASLLRARQCARYLATLAKSRPDLSADRRASIEALRDAPYGVDEAAIAAAQRAATTTMPPTAEQRAAAEALRRRREANEAAAQRQRLAGRPQTGRPAAPEA